MANAPAGTTTVTLPHQTIAAALKAATTKYASQIAITCMGTNVTFAELEKSASQFADFLATGFGLKKGDRIAIMLPNIPQFTIAFYAAQKLGLICINTNPLYTPREMKHQFRDSQIQAVIILDMFYDKLQEIRDELQLENIIVTRFCDFMPPLQRMLVKTMMRLKKQLPQLSGLFTPWCLAIRQGNASKCSDTSLGLDDIALLQYTGGTTGVAKGAMLTHRNVLSNVEQINILTQGKLTPGKETVLTALPLYHIFALTVNFLTFITQGHRLILVPRPTPISNTVRMFAKYPISVMTGVNTLFNGLLASKEFKELKQKKVRIAIAGGMALQETVAAQWLKITGNKILQGYGLTEASPVTHMTPLDEDLPAGTIGKPLPGTKAKLVGDDGHEVADGTPGELLIQGPQVMAGYWNMPGETEQVLKQDWLYTGDIAKRDAKGLYYIVDRKKELILVSGFNVFPNEVEDVIALHPKVLEVAVIGIPSRSTGEAVKAVVVKRDATLTVEELKRHCEQNLTGYKRPRVFEFRETLPKSIIGKILRKDLKVAHEKGLD